MLHGKALMKVPKILGLVLLLGVFFWSCEDANNNAASNDKNELGLGSYLDDTQTFYTFYIDSFMQSSQVVYNVGNVNDRDDILMIPDVWNGVNVRWGFRRKPSDSSQETKIYWWQKSTVDVDTQNVYATEVKELEKAYFTPTSLPAALMSEESIEVYAVLEVGGYKISQVYDLPADFKTRVLGSSVIEGMIVNGDAVKAGRSPSRVEGAAVFAIHKGTGTIFQGFSGENGRYRITVNGKGAFSLAALRYGFQPRMIDKSITSSVSGVDITINELTSGTRIVPKTLYELGGASPLSALNSDGYLISGTAVDVSNGVKGVPGAFVVFYDRTKDEASFLQADSTGSFNLNLPLDSSVREDDLTTLSVVGAAYGYAPQRGSEVIGAPNSASTLLGTVAFVEDGTSSGLTELTWGPQSTGGPSNFSKEPIKLHFPSGGIQAKMYLLAKGAFVPADVDVVWQIDGNVVPGASGMSATLPLLSERRYTVSAGFTDSRQKKVLLERVFDLGASYKADADDPVVVFNEDAIRGGILDSEDTDADGNPRINIDPDNDENPSVSVTPGVKAIDPDTGTGEGLIYNWNVNGEPAGSGVSPTLPLKPGTNTVTLTVRSKDKDNIITVNRIYVVGATGSGNGGSGNGGSGDGNGDGTGAIIPGDNTGDGTISGNSLNVSFGYGSSGGIISSGNLGSKANPLSYSTKGSTQFTVTLKALVSGSTTGALTYAWSIHDVVTDALIADSFGGTRTGQLETFSLQTGSYAIVVKVTDASNRSGEASRAFKIVADSAVQLPTGTKGEWLANSSGGAGDLADDSEKTTFKDEGGKPVAVRVATDVSDPSGNSLTPMEWYVDGVLQEGIGSLDTLLQLPSGGGSSPATRVVLGVGRGSGTNQEPVTVRRVFTLNPATAKSPLGPELRWDTSSLDPAVIHNFNGSDPVQLILSVVATSSGSQVFTYAWTLNGSPVAGQTTKTAILNLSRPGVNTVSVRVSNSGGSAELTRDYKLNNLPVVTVISDKAGAVIGENIQISANVVDADGASTFTYTWKIKGSTATLWESIPGLNPQPTASTFSLPTDRLAADTYKVQVTVGDRGANVPAETNFVLNATSGGPQIAWGTSSLDPTKTHSFDSTTGQVLNLAVNLLNNEVGETYTYEWKLNDAVISGATGNSLTQTLAQAGTNVVSVKVSNSKGSAVLEQSYILNTLPKLTMVLSENSAVAGKALTAIAAPSDPDAGTTFSFVWKLQRPGTSTWIDIPGLAKQPTFAAFELPTTGFASGAYKLQVAVSDGMGGTVTAEDTFAIVANSVPTLGEIEFPFGLKNGDLLQVNSAIPVSKPGTFSTTANDPDGEPITYIWRINGYLVSSGPTPNALIDLGTPPAVNTANPNVRVISVEAKDPEGGSTIKSVTIEVNHLPKATIDVGGRTGSGTVPVSAVVVDVDSNSNFSYVWKFQRPGETAWIDIPGMSTQPTGATFDLPLTGLTAGTYKLQLKVTDNKGASTTVNTDLVVTVASNRAPTVSVSSSTDVNGDIAVTATASDPDGDPLTYSWEIRQGTAAWASIEGNPTTAKITLPANLAAGTYEVRVTVSDGKGGSASDKTDVTVLAQSLKVTVTSTVKPDGDVVLEAVIVDPEGGDLTYKWEIRPKEPNAVWADVPNGPTTKVFTLSPDVKQGTYEIRVTVTDDKGTKTAAKADVTVPNRAPQVSVSSVTDSTSGEVVVTATASDPEGDALSYKWEIRAENTATWNEVNNAWGTTRNTADGSIFTVSSDVKEGTYNVRITATDAKGAKTSKETDANVPNRAPVVTVTSEIDPDGDVLVKAVVIDPEGDDVTYTWDMRPKDPNAPWVSIPGDPTGPTFTLPPEVKKGVYEVRVRVTDDEGGVTPKIADVSVPNRAPVVTITSENPNGDIIVKAVAVDPEGGDLTYTWDMRPKDPNAAWVSIPGNPTGPTFTLPPEVKKGVYEVRIRVTDDEGAVTPKITDVSVPNRAPVVTVTSEVKPDGNIPDGNIVVTAKASDLDGDSLTYTWRIRSTTGSSTWDPVEGNPTGPSFTIPSSVAVGEYWVQASVSDGTSSGSGQTKITVLGANQNPVVSVSSSTDSNGDIVVTATASDPDNDPLTYTWEMRVLGLNAWGPILDMTPQPSGSSFTLPSSVAAGIYEIQATVRDGRGGSASEKVRVNKFDATGVPVVSVSSETLSNGRIRVTAVAADPANATLLYEWKIGLKRLTTLDPIDGNPTTPSFILPLSYAPEVYTIQITVVSSRKVARATTDVTVKDITLDDGGDPAVFIVLPAFLENSVPLTVNLRNAPANVTYSYNWKFTKEKTEDVALPYTLVKSEQRSETISIDKLDLLTRAQPGTTQLGLFPGDYWAEVTASGSDGSTLTAEEMFVTIVGRAIVKAEFFGNRASFYWDPVTHAQSYRAEWRIKGDDWQSKEFVYSPFQISPPFPENLVGDATKQAKYRIWVNDNQPRHLVLSPIEYGIQGNQIKSGEITTFEGNFTN